MELLNDSPTWWCTNFATSPPERPSCLIARGYVETQVGIYPGRATGQTDRRSVESPYTVQTRQKKRQPCQQLTEDALQASARPSATVVPALFLLKNYERYV
jgi:hypothetical protein